MGTYSNIMLLRNRPGLAGAWAFLLVGITALDPKRVHLIDSFPRSAPRNFFFRGNNPMPKGTSEYNVSMVRDILMNASLQECEISLPHDFRMITLDLENLQILGTTKSSNT